MNFNNGMSEEPNLRDYEPDAYNQRAMFDEYPEEENEDELEEVHMTPEEVLNLIEMQGEDDRDENGNLILRKLGELLKDPEIRQYIENLAAQNDDETTFANQIMREEMARGGQAGHPMDTERVLAPKHVTKLFDKLIGGPSINKETGNKQYFLGSLLGSLGGALMSGLGGLGKAAGSALLGSGNLIRSAMPAIGNAIGGAAKTAGRSALQHFGSQMFNPDFFSRQGIMNAGRGAINQFGNQFGNQMMNQGREAINRMPGSIGQMARGAMQGGMESYRPDMGFNPSSAMRLGTGAFLGAAREGMNRFIPMAQDRMRDFAQDMTTRRMPQMVSEMSNRYLPQEVARNVNDMAMQGGRELYGRANDFMDRTSDMMRERMGNIYNRYTSNPMGGSRGRGMPLSAGYGGGAY